MPHWQDEGIILRRRSLGEGKAIIDIFTKAHGRAAGIVRLNSAVRSHQKDKTSAFQIGMVVSATWRARLREHLGQWQLESGGGHIAHLLGERALLHVLLAKCSLLSFLLPEHDPHPHLYTLFKAFLHDKPEPELLWHHYIKFELCLLQELGFGLELDRCVVTQANSNLKWVSPKTGKAVGAEAGAPYATKLLPLPAFLYEGTAPSQQDMVAAFDLTGYFLHKHFSDLAAYKEWDIQRRSLRGMIANDKAS